MTFHQNTPNTYYQELQETLMDPMSFFLEDPLYHHITNDMYGFESLEIPFEFAVNPEPNQTLEEPYRPTQISMDMNNNDPNPRDYQSHDVPRMEGGDQGNEPEIMNGEVRVEEPKTNGDRKRRKKEKKKADKVMEKEKLMMHREIERQRRQAMSSLHRSLRSLLPAEYLKGKRSMSDHLHEAVKYIRHMKANNQVLKDKREKLKTPQSVATNQINPSSSIHDLHNHQDRIGSTGGVDARCLTRFAEQVVVKTCKEGVEVLVRVNRQDECGNGIVLSTSRVLKALMQEGLDVTSCISTPMENNRWLHCIQAHKVGQESNIYTDLQQRLTKKLSAD